VGQTENLMQRAAEQNGTGRNDRETTKLHGRPWTLVWHENHPNGVPAMAHSSS